MAVSRQVSVAGMQTLETPPRDVQPVKQFNWGDPGVDQAAGGTIANINSGQFGRITTQAGTPRIIQLGVKYTFCNADRSRTDLEMAGCWAVFRNWVVTAV